jgi:hypothetical protein
MNQPRAQQSRTGVPPVFTLPVACAAPSSPAPVEVSAATSGIGVFSCVAVWARVFCNGPSSSAQGLSECEDRRDACPTLEAIVCR